MVAVVVLKMIPVLGDMLAEVVVLELFGETIDLILQLMLLTNKYLKK